MVDIRSVEVRTHGRFLIESPATFGPHPLLVGFHGYGENAERHLEDLRRVPGTGEWILCAVQGLHRFYAPKMADVVASWMTRQDRELAITDNVAYVDRVVAAIGLDHDITRLVLAGFSQGVAMALRAARAGAWRADGIIALGGDIPPDVREGGVHDLPPLLIGRGVADPWYTAEKHQADRAFLDSVGANAQVVTFDGGHEWTDEFREAAGRFLARVIDSPRAS
jgi:predicted esterase